MAASTGRETYGHQSDTYSASVQRELDKLFEYGVLIQQFLQENDVLQIFFERNSHTFYAVPRVLKYKYSNLVRITAKDLLSPTLNGALEDIGTMRRMVIEQPALSCELFFAEDSPQVFLALNTDFPRELPTGPDGRWDIKPLRTAASLRGDADDLFDMSGFLFLRTENLEDRFSKWGLSRFAWRNLGLALMALAVERPGFLAIADKKLRFEEQERRLQQRLTTAGGRGAPAGDVAALQSAGKKMMIVFGCLLLLFAGLAFGAYWILGEAFGGCKNATFKEIMDMEDAATLADELNNNSDGAGLHLQDRDLHRRERAESRAAHLYRAQDVEAEGDPRVRLLALLKQAESQNSAEKFDASKCTIPLELEPRLVFVPLRETPFNPVQCEYLWLRKELVRVNDSAVIAACSATVNHAHKSGKTTIYWTELSDEKGEDWNDTAEDSADEKRNKKCDH
eukprot:g31.t1